ADTGHCSDRRYAGRYIDSQLPHSRRFLCGGETLRRGEKAHAGSSNRRAGAGNRRLRSEAKAWKVGLARFSAISNSLFTTKTRTKAPGQKEALKLSLRGLVPLWLESRYSFFAC